MTVLRRKDWTLLAIAAARDAQLTPVHLQKVLFLLGERQKPVVGKSFYRFRPYNYGPFSAEIYSDADALESEGLVRIDRQAPGRSWALYGATAAGLQRAEDLAAATPPDAVDYLSRLVEWAKSLSFHQLVSAVYRAYPSQRARSIFVD